MRRLLFLSAVALGWCVMVHDAAAQTWSDGRSRPTLFQIISVDPSGDAGWPYGQEDPAGDGFDTLQPDEAAIDLRTVYADADGNRLWLRAYATGQTAPGDTAVAFFFLDVDDNRNTGGGADDTTLFRAFTLDPTPGGYDYAFGVDGRGVLIDAFAYRAQMGGWVREAVGGNDVDVEVDADRDPIDSSNVDRAYFQIDVAHAVTGLNANCEARVFVRLHNDDEPNRDFGDDDEDDTVAMCRPALNGLGDPIVLQTDACNADGDCPAGGRCEGGICVVEYSCGGNLDCRDDQACRDGRCVVVVDRACTDFADCNGLVCDAGQCVACSTSGATACADGFVCSSLGRCVDAGDVAGTPDGGVDPLDIEGEVRGGAFKCSAGTSDAATRGLWLWVLAVLSLLLRRLVRAQRGVRSTGGRL